MSTILPPDVGTPASEWAEGTHDLLHKSKDAEPTTSEYVATGVKHQDESATPAHEFPGGYPQTPGAPIPMGTSAGIGGGVPSDGPGLVETAKQYIPTTEQIGSYLPAAVAGYFPGAKQPEHESEPTPPASAPISAATALHQDSESLSASTKSPFTPETKNSFPSTKDSLPSNNRDPLFANLSTQAVAGTPGEGPGFDLSPHPTRSSPFNPTTDVVPDKGVDKVTLSDSKERVVDSNDALVTPNTSTSSPILPKSLGDQEKPLPDSPAPPIPQLGVRDHPLPPIANQESKHVMGDEIIDSPISKPSLGSSAVGIDSNRADVGHSLQSANGASATARPSTDATGSKFHETTSKASVHSKQTSGSGSSSSPGKIKFADKIKGEMKILSGKMSHDEEKIEEGKRMMGKV